jgi:hypothetical protein
MSLDKITLLDENILNYKTRPFRNLIINGDMSISQRANSSNNITTSNYYTVDRWVTNISSLSTWTSSVENDAPLILGIKKSLKTTSNASVNTIGDNGFAMLQHRMEGQHLQILKKGTINSENITLSFWVKSNVTGNYIVELYDNDNVRSISKNYSITSSATWEKKNIFIPRDLVGTLSNDANLSLSLNFWLSAGNNFKSGILNNVNWNSAINSHRAVGQINLALNNNNYFQITGVQLEAGNDSSEFEILPHEIQMLRCQRYYYKNTVNVAGGVFCNGYANSGLIGEGFVKYPITMRAIPQSLETTGSPNDYQIKYLQTTATCSSVPIHSSATTADGGYVQFTVASVLTAGHGIALRSNTGSAYLAWSVEL